MSESAPAGEGEQAMTPEVKRLVEAAEKERDVASCAMKYCDCSPGKMAKCDAVHREFQAALAAVKESRK